MSILVSVGVIGADVVSYTTAMTLTAVYSHQAPANDSNDNVNVNDIDTVLASN